VVLIAEGRHRGDEHASDLERRHLHDVAYDVVERRRTPDEFVAAFAEHGIDVSIEQTERNFTIATGRHR
jgi:hypothetical protein